MEVNDDRETHTTLRELSEAEKDENTAGNHCELCGEFEDECICEDRCEFITAEKCAAGFLAHRMAAGEWPDDECAAHPGAFENAKQLYYDEHGPSQKNEDAWSGGFCANH